MMRNRKNSTILNALGLISAKKEIGCGLLESLSRKMETKIMITNLCISKGSRYETQRIREGWNCSFE